MIRSATRTITRLAIALALSALLGVPALAWGSLTIRTSLTDEVAEELNVGEVGDALYEAQEGVHDAVTDTTGVEIEHDYIDICAGDECVPVDPIRYSN